MSDHLPEPHWTRCPCGKGVDTDGDGDCPACARKFRSDSKE